ncbi:von Hippel-Lindau-like protein [Electrophorus electricus]|uniref:SOCS box domain-containing protein n=1 Tax=Electrophorus electricus TaxID=8005 RepID=A0A4W4GMK2_ELEEL|nr:von Hippel-Lindau-like protein [Electrophorus electricus]
MADQEALQPLKSLNSYEPTYIDFVNKSSGNARVWWLNFSGAPVSYGDIRPGQTLKMNTFLTHPWIFRASDGSKLLANFGEVYFPAAALYGDDGNPLFRTVTITAPVYSLQEYCSKLIRKLVRKEDIDKLEIPEFLRKDIRRTPNLLQ